MAVWLGTSLRNTKIRSHNLQIIAQSILTFTGHSKALLSVYVVGKTRMQSLNRRFRQKDYPTDVLAFPATTHQKSCTPLLGDVIICLPVALTQASRFGNTHDEEMARLLIHGILHLLGFDHERSSRQARLMEKTELRIFESLQPIPRLVRS